VTSVSVFTVGLAASTLLLGSFPSPAGGALPRVAQSRSLFRADFFAAATVITLREKGSLMVRIAAGSTWLGSTELEIVEAAALCAEEPLAQRCNEHTFENEFEKRREQVPSFWIDRYEVSVREYMRCVRVGACQPPGYASGGDRFNRPDYPVSFVTHADAAAYCRFRGARLPHEAEFERAARGSNGRAYPWGELYNGRVLNHGRLGVFENDPSDGFAELAPVGSFPDGRSPEGVFDLAGNVAEWQAEPYRESSKEPFPEENESAPRVARGGSFLRAAAFVRGAARERFAATTQRPDLGLRCARSAQDSAR
jgi:formylglycine-generating enzyme required for sulfatase activity